MLGKREAAPVRRIAHKLLTVAHSHFFRSSNPDADHAHVLLYILKNYWQSAGSSMLSADVQAAETVGHSIKLLNFAHILLTGAHKEENVISHFRPSPRFSTHSDIYKNKCCRKAGLKPHGGGAAAGKCFGAQFCSILLTCSQNRYLGAFARILAQTTSPPIPVDVKHYFALIDDGFTQ